MYINTYIYIYIYLYTYIYTVFCLNPGKHFLDYKSKTAVLTNAEYTCLVLPPTEIASQKILN